MQRHNAGRMQMMPFSPLAGRRCYWLIVVLAAAAWPAAADPQPQAPQIAPLDQHFLTRLVRRTIEQRIQDSTVYETPFVPATLREVSCQAIVTLRQFGRPIGIGSGRWGPAHQSCGEAAIAALLDAEKRGPVPMERLGRLLIEIEATGAAVPFTFNGDWDDRNAFVAIIEPGIDGVRMTYGEAMHQFAPSELVAKNISAHHAMNALAEQIVADPFEMSNGTMARFRATHWHELKPGGKVVQLRRGLAYVSPDAVTKNTVDAAIESLSEYMVYRQLPTGLFSYEYEPSKDVYTDDNNLVRQAGVAWSLALHARLSGKSATRAASKRCIDALLRRLTPLQGVEDAAFIAGQEGRHKLGITALTTLATLEHPDGARYDDARRKMLNAMCWLQVPEGMFVTVFPPTGEVSSQYYFPGQTLLAIARDYQVRPNERATNVFRSAFTYYSDLYHREPRPPFVPWHSQAFSIMAQPTKRRAYADFVFEMTDWLLKDQRSAANSEWPELFGGVEAYIQNRVGIATASYLEGIVDALLLARALGDESRADRYESATRAALRFVLQLQFKPQEAYYIRSPRDVIGAMRTSPTNNILRIDHCQHALSAMIKARAALFEQGG